MEEVKPEETIQPTFIEEFNFEEPAPFKKPEKFMNESKIKFLQEKSKPQEGTIGPAKSTSKVSVTLL